MKKILSVVIAISMLLGMMIPMGITASAAEVTECATWAEVVAAVEADSAASIKLTADVTANSTIESFAGTFDGNGKTVTVETTMFTTAAEGSTFKNFTMNGTTTVSPFIMNAGAATEAAPITIKDVTSNVNVTITTGTCASFIAMVPAVTTFVVMDNCVSNGTINSSNQVGAFIGRTNATALTAKFTNCVNNSDVSTSNSYAGGFIGMLDSGKHYITIDRCENNGTITATASDAAGFIGDVAGSSENTVTITNSLNSGKIVNNKPANDNEKYSASGFVARVDAATSVSISNCLSTATAFESTVGHAAYFCNYKKADTTTFALTNCYYVDANLGALHTGALELGEGYEMTAVTAEQLASGEIAYKLGEAWGQKIDTDAEAEAVPSIGGETVYQYTNGTYSNTPEGQGGTDEPDTTERFSYVYETQYGKAVIDGPLYMTVGSEDAITVTFTGPSLYALGAGFSSSDTSVIAFNGLATCVTDPVVNWTDSTPEAPINKLPSASCGTSVDIDPFTKAVITVPIAALKAGSSVIELDEDNGLRLFHMDTIDFVDVKVEDGVSIGYTITVIDENADEPTSVDLFNVNGYVAPTVGADIIDPMTFLSVPADAPYSIIEAYWYNDSPLDTRVTEGTFLAGYSYSLGVMIRLADGYVFADEYTVQLNGDASLVDVGECYEDNATDLKIWSVITELPAEGGEGGDEPIEPTLIETIGINGFVKPTEGASVAENIAALQAAGEGYTISAVWYTLGNELAGDTFGTSAYFLRVAITANEGYVIADNATFTINGGANDDLIDTTSTVYEGGASALLDTVYITVEGEGGDEPIVIDTINVNGYVAPTVGASLADTLANLSVPAGAPYSIVDAYWYNNTLDTYATEETFLAGYSYSLGVDIKLAEGYVLAAEWTAQFNGDATIVDSNYMGINNEGAEYDLYFYSVITALDPLGIVDTINVLGYVAPTVGADIAESLAGLSVPNGALYSIIDFFWYDITNDAPLMEGTFEAGCTYALNVEVVPTAGYHFADEYTVQLNGDASLVDVEATYEANATDLMLWSVITELPAEGGDEPTEPDGSEENPFVITNKDDVDAIDVPAGMTYYFIIDPWNVPETSLEDFIGNLLKVIGEGATINGGETLDLPTNGRMGWPVLFSITAGANENAGAEIVVPKGTFNNPDTFDENGEAEIALTSPKNDFEPYIFLFTADETGLLTVTAPEGAVVTINNLTTYQYGDSGVNTAFVKEGDEIQVIVATEGADVKGKVSISIDPIIIDAVDVSGITAPESGKTVADYAASFVPELPADAKYSILSISWFELDPETLGSVADFLPDDYVFDSTKTYGFQLLVKADDGYEFATDAVITANGGTTELLDSIADGNVAALAIVFNPAPATGDNSAIAIFAIAAVATIGCVALALRKKKED